jgi:hypothetical protein
MMWKEGRVGGTRKARAFIIVAVLVLFVACTKGREESVTVPTDCQQFLDQYFGAWKSKDVGTLQTLSFYLSPEERSRLPEGSLELWRQSKNQLVTENFQKMTSLFGDFKDYKVLRVKTTTIAPQDQPAANMVGSGVHTELVCKARFSKKHDVQVGFHLIKETEGSQYVAAAWNFQATP